MKLLNKARQFDVLFVGGKGGVGKTTSAAALAVQFAELGKKTLIISTDPAHSLGDVLQTPLSGDIRSITDYLSAMELDPQIIADAHFTKVEETMRAYAKPDMMPALRKHLTLAKSAPGAEEAAMLEAICHYLVGFQEMGFDKLIFDTAPTGHTLRLMILPEMMQAWTDSLIKHQHQQKKFRDVLNFLSKDDIQSKQGLRLEKATSILNARKALFEEARKRLYHGGGTGIFLVMIPEMLPLAETVRACEQMHTHHLPLAGIIINQVMNTLQTDPFWQQRADRQQDILSEIDKQLATVDKFFLPLLVEDIRGLEALRKLPI